MILTNTKCPVCQAKQPSHSNSIKLPRKLWNLDIKRAVKTKLLCSYCSKKAEDYCCISYVWSNLDAFCSRLYTCTENQAISGHKEDSYNYLLSTICQRFQTSYLWFDRLCVPHNPQEKSSDIMLMGEYYHQARLCIALFDQVVADGDSITESLGAGRLRRWLVSGGDDDFWYYYWAIERLNSNGMCEDSWFERVWTAQEFCRSQSCVAWDGQNSLNLTRLAATFVNAERKDPVAVKSRLNSLPRAFAQTMLLWRESFFGMLDFAAALCMTKSRKCALEEDRVYGILGLLKHPLQFPVVYNIGLEKTLVRALKAAIEIGDVSFLMTVDDSSQLFPAYNVLVKRGKSIRLGNIGSGKCKLDGKGMSIPVIHKSQAVHVLFGEERGKKRKKTDSDVRIYLSILHWLAYLAKYLNVPYLRKNLKEATLSTLVDCFSPSDKVGPKLMHWFKNCIACPVDNESIQNLFIDQPDIVSLLISRRLYRDHEWVLLELEHEVDSIHPKFVIGNTVSILEEPISCLFLDIPIDGRSNKMFFIVCKERDGVFSRVGFGVCDRYKGQCSPSQLTIK